MKLIKPSYEIIEQEPGFDGMIKHIERVGRTCYKSEDKITDESAPKFVEMLKNRGHGAMLEHGTVYLKTNNTEGSKSYFLHSKYSDNKYSSTSIHEYTDDLSNRGIPYTEYYITTNYRVLIENNWLDDLQYLYEPTDYHIKRISVKFTCDRGVSHEFVRHRVFSFAQESTRYCNYSKDKFGNEITYIMPNWTNIECLNIDGSINIEGKFPEGSNRVEDDYILSLHGCEEYYFKLLEQGWTAQQARSVLPNSLKTELIMTGTIGQWKGFFKLRDDKAAHPQARELAAPLHQDFIERGWL